MKKNKPTKKNRKKDKNLITLFLTLININIRNPFTRGSLTL